MKKLNQFALFASVLSCVAPFVSAGEQHGSKADSQSHAPIGVMADHMHKSGEWMFSYRYMYMEMEGNRDGTNSISPDEIILVPNTFGMPMNLRVVPTKMTMDMHMLGAMYAPSDAVTLMGMVNYISKDMDHITYSGGMGTVVEGRFTTKTSGIGDTSLSALVRVGDGLHATIGVSLPTGSTDETDTILNPAGMQPTVRLPYPMQLGSGTYDLIAGVTYSEKNGLWNWGGQWKSIIRMGENSEDYSLGDEHRLGWWLSYALSNNVSINTRVEYLNRGNIDGQDPDIALPVQTADPNRQGLDRVDANVGVNWQLPNIKHRLALELGAPVYQDLKGPQLETDAMVTLGWQYAL